jgi:hypothetical protein
MTTHTESRLKGRDRPHHGLSAPGRMKTIRSFLFVAFAWVTCLCASLAAEESKYPSPDGRFALRITESNGGDSGERKVELIEKTSGRAVVDLGTAWRGQVLVWSGRLKVGSVWQPRR